MSYNQNIGYYFPLTSVVFYLSFEASNIYVSVDPRKSVLKK